MKRHIDLVVISDVHLGTYGCHAQELTQYLGSIQPDMLILNGDFIDTWQFKKTYFPAAHMEVINQIIRMSVKGTKVYYITGNHDDVLRKFTDFSAGNIHLQDKLVLSLSGKKYWIFHGDIFDISIISTPWLARMGGKGYDWLILANRFINKLRRAMGMDEWSFSGAIKQSVKKAVKFIDDFEQKAIDVAAEKGYDAVVCGHIHIPVIRNVATRHKDVLYLNSGDWIENLTSLEYNKGNWDLYKYHKSDYSFKPDREAKKNGSPRNGKRQLHHIELLEKIMETGVIVKA